jgi:hypothetical protein
MLENVHFDCPISSSANDFVCDKVNAVDFVSVARQVRFEFVCFEVPDLPKKMDHCISKNAALQKPEEVVTLRVLSLLALTSKRESALQASRYTALMCPRSVATNFPVFPSHRRTLLSHAALAAQRPSGLNTTCATCR